MSALPIRFARWGPFGLLPRLPNVKYYFTGSWCGANLSGIYLLKVNNTNTRTRCEICSKLTIKTPDQFHSRRFGGGFFVNFEHMSDLVLVFLLLTVNM